MALHLNLNHERERVRAERRRDPLKLSMIGLTVVVAGLVAQYFWALGKSAIKTRELEAKRAEFAQLSPLATAASAEEAELKKKLANSDAFLKRIEGRFHWAPLLQELIQNVPANIQINRFAGDASGDDGKKVQFNLDGSVAGPDFRAVAEEFRQNLGELLGKKYRNVNATFRSLEENTERDQVEGKTGPTASFAINIQFQVGDLPTAATAKKH